MSTLSRSLVAVCATASLVFAGATTAFADEVDRTPGTVVAVEELAPELWLPGTAEAKRITYWTVGSDNRPALSTGAFFVPEGTAPEGGWPVIGWAHGTSGVDDACAPSLVGPADPERDRQYLGAWLGQGYAIAATDYVGLGTPGIMPYLDGKVSAHSVVDSVEHPERSTRPCPTSGSSSASRRAVAQRSPRPATRRNTVAPNWITAAPSAPVFRPTSNWHCCHWVPVFCRYRPAKR